MFGAILDTEFRAILDTEDRCTVPKAVTLFFDSGFQIPNLRSQPNLRSNLRSQGREVVIKILTKVLVYRVHICLSALLSEKLVRSFKVYLREIPVCLWYASLREILLLMLFLHVYLREILASLALDILDIRGSQLVVGKTFHFALIYLMFLWLVKVGCLRLVISLYRCHTLESLLKNKNINNYLSQIVVVLLSLSDFTADNTVEKLLKCFPD